MATIWLTSEQIDALSPADFKSYVLSLRQAVGAASGKIFTDENNDDSVFAHDPLHPDQVLALQDSFITALNAAAEFPAAIAALVTSIGTRAGVHPLSSNLPTLDDVAGSLRSVGQDLDTYLATL